MASPANRSRIYCRAIVAVALFLGGEGAALAQSFTPIQRSQEDEKHFRKAEYRSYAIKRCSTCGIFI